MQNKVTSKEDIDDREAFINNKNILKTFLNKYRQCLYHHQFLDILLFHKYHPKPLVENVNKSYSHTSSLKVISAIHTILTNASSKNLMFYVRKGCKVSVQPVPKCFKELPTYENLQIIRTSEKIELFFDILDIKQEFIQNCLQVFPTSWQFFSDTIEIYEYSL